MDRERKQVRHNFISFCCQNIALCEANEVLWFTCKHYFYWSM